MAVFLDGIFVCSRDPENETPDSALRGQIMAHDRRAKPARLESRSHAPVPHGGGQALSFKKEQCGQSAIVLYRENLTALNGYLQLVRQGQLIGIPIEQRFQQTKDAFGI